MNQNLITRIVTGLVAGTVAITALVISPYGVWAFCAILSMLGLWEMMSTSGVETRSLKWVAMIFGAGFWIVRLLHLTGMELPVDQVLPYGEIALLIFPITALFALFTKQIQHPIQQLSTVIFASLYAYLPFHLFYLIAVPEALSLFDWRLPLGIMLLIWTLDSMAYFSGRFLGKNLLFERISPKKTWEGSIGGALCCIGLGVAFQYWMPQPGINWIIVSVLVSVFGQFGDLVESMFKRSLNLKDSGNILPGHGGILDRFDGFYLVIPFIFLYFFLL